MKFEFMRRAPVPLFLFPPRPLPLRPLRPRQEVEIIFTHAQDEFEIMFMPATLRYRSAPRETSLTFTPCLPRAPQLTNP